MSNINILKKKIIPLIFCFGIISTISMFVPSTTKAATLLNAPLIYQLPELKNGCEVTSLAMLLQYRGINVSKMTLANQVKKDPTPYHKVGSTIYWGNPNTGFVGDITGNSIGYSVYHGPVYQLASQYTNMIDLTGNSFDVISKQLDSGNPVWVITTSTFDTVPSSQWQTLQTPTGPISMTFHEHSVLLTGYDNNYVYFNDPLANIKNRRVSRTAFIRGWEQFGKQAMTYGSAIGMIDSPVSGLKVNDNINISGWFLDDGGVSKIEVLVDGKVTGQAIYGDARPDVQNAYPNYYNGNAGYHYLLDITQLSGGIHSITVRETGKSGYVTTLPERTITVSPVRGILDSPTSDSHLKGIHNVSGWFLDENGVSKIDVLVDGKLAGQATYGDVRPDVQRAYPEYNNGNAGFHYSLDTTNFSDGPHTVTVRETSTSGRVTTLAEKPVTISNVKGYLDNPADNSNIKGSTNVSGWFLDESGVAKIEILVDDRVAGQAVYGDARTDVRKVFPEYNNGNSGYHYSFDSSRFNDGPHTITVRETGTNGKVTTLPERNVTFSNVKGYMDNPTPSSKLTGITNVSGWFLDTSGVSKIEILVDGAVVGQAVYGDARLDVKSAFPEYNNVKSGYHYPLDTTRFSEGIHTVTVRETGENGFVTTLLENKVTFTNTVKSYLENPTSDTKLKGITNVSGWFLDPSGVSKIEVLIDGEIAGQAFYGDERVDVKNVFPEYNNGNAGFHFALDTTRYIQGIHTLTVRETGKNGQIKLMPEITVTFF
ncbi:Ig-like domain-containing protein [Bacillus sp. 1P10SD]|uniref:Ig-like domain-containing protein n=1 Tax=Bacillus sp. 1P10SD TaxID=3132265 RepID=UPI0039A62409